MVFIDAPDGPFHLSEAWADACDTVAGPKRGSAPILPRWHPRSERDYYVVSLEVIASRADRSADCAAVLGSGVTGSSRAYGANISCLGT